MAEGSNGRPAGNRRYALDEHYFDEIDAPDKAYWLGFLAGDGYVCTERGYVSLALAQKDLAHIEALRAAVGSTAPIRVSMNPGIRKRRYPRGRLVLHSRWMADALMMHGLTQGKSLTLKPWDGPEHLMRHYWRGLIDADGTIGKLGQFHILLVGSRAVVEGFRSWIAMILPSFNAKIFQKNSEAVWQIRISGRVACRTVSQALYTGRSMALERKAERALAIIATGPTVIGTPEYSAMQSAKRLGRKFPNGNHDANRTPEFREAARQRATGRRASAETRQKMSIAHRRRHADRSPEERAEIARKISEGRRRASAQ